jgi:hypothetical protein
MRRPPREMDRVRIGQLHQPSTSVERIRDNFITY